MSIFWLGTSSGLGRFDGTSFRLVEIKNEEGRILKTYAVKHIVKSKTYENIPLPMYTI